MDAGAKLLGGKADIPRGQTGADLTFRLCCGLFRRGDCYESLAAVNSGLAEGEKVSAVEPGRLYGDAAAKTLRVVYNPAGTRSGNRCGTGTPPP